MADDREMDALVGRGGGARCRGCGVSVMEGRVRIILRPPVTTVVPVPAAEPLT